MSLLQTFFNSEVMLDSLPALLRGLRNTLLLSFFSILCGVLLGLLVCLIRLYAPLLLRAIAIVYIDLFRAMPMLVILILIYYALPFLGVRFSSWTSAILAFSLVMGAYSAEVFRAGVEGVPRGQFEAAGALGLPFLLTLRRVALPELLNEATNSQALYANPSPLIMAAIIYVVFLWPMVRLVSVLEQRLKASP